MDNEILALIQLISKKTYLTLNDIQLSLSMTKRQATYRIEKLNQLLEVEKVPVINVGSAKDIIVCDETRKIIHKLINKTKNSNHYYLSKKERLIYMYLMLFMNLDYLSLNHFIDALGVSRSTVLLDFKELVQILEEKNIHVRNTRSKGYYLVGSEMDIRRMMMKYVIYTLAEEESSKVFDIFIDDLYLDIFDYSKLVISELATKHKIRFVEDRLIEFIYIFIFLKARMQSGKDAASEIIKMIDVSVISSMKEYEFTIDLLKNYKYTDRISKIDIYYISSWILGISFGDINEDTKDCILISDIIGKIMTRFESLSGTHYKNTEEIFIQLYSHFRPAYYRLLFKLPIFNPLCEKVKEEYKQLYHLVSETMKPINVLFGSKIPSDEIAYLTMHFATIYSDKKDCDITTQKTALVVCSKGIGSSAILYNELTNLFPELYFLPPTDFSRISDYDDKADIIFTTSYISHMFESKIPIIRVSPVMSISERYQVVREVYLQLGSTFLKKPNVDVVMKIVSQYADVKEENALYSELINYFSNVEMDGMLENLGLIDIINENIINLNLEAIDWEDAIRKSYAKMLDLNIIEQSYIEDAIHSVKMIGPYFVITKHIALPHAKPESGANRCAIGISVLKEAIEFGSEENDPVKYIFSLSATDNETHLHAMSQLVELFDDKNFYDVLDNATNPKEIIEYIKKN